MATLQLSAEDDAYYKNLIDQLFEGKQDTDVFAADDITLQKNIKKLLGGMQEGYEKKLSEVDYNSTDDEMLKAMEKNVYEFSCAKNYQQMKALNDALRDGDRIKTFAEFKKDAEAILNDYNIRHLQTEYNHAIAASQMCSKWQAYPAGALLQYLTVGDERVRKSHSDLDGVVAVKESDFWDTYYPPIDWNCRCTVIEVLDEEPTDLDSIPLPTVPSIFAPNVGKYGTVYAKNSSYFEGVPKQVLRNAAQHMPLHHQYKVIHKGPGAGFVKIHHVADNVEERNVDHDAMMRISKHLANQGHKVEILPRIHFKDIDWRNQVLPDAKTVTNCDTRIDGMLVELKSFTTHKERTMVDACNKGLTQGDGLLLEFKDKQNLDWLYKFIDRSPNLKALWIEHYGTITRLK
jgi:SPP1 gp7 family putative phage head morphogenesis protein